MFLLRPETLEVPRPETPCAGNVFRCLAWHFANGELDAAVG
jgi:hypothetical protein